MSGTYITRQTWTLLEVASQDKVRIVNINNINQTFSSNNVLEVVEGDSVQLECEGETGVVPAPEYSWNMSGEQSQDLSGTLLNITGAGLELNGSVVTCSSRQYNTYSGDLMFQTSVSVMIIVQVPVLEFSSFTQSR